MSFNPMTLADLPRSIEIRLWQAVIVGAIQEWISGSLRCKRQAEEFLFQDKKDFPIVCESAGLDPDVLRSKLRRLRLQRTPAA